MLASALGYFCHDFIAMRHEMLNDKGDVTVTSFFIFFFCRYFGLTVFSICVFVGMVLHHVAGITLIAGVIKAGRSVRRFIPAIAVIELSSVFLSLMWLVKEVGWESSRTFKAILGLFASSFFATRVVGMNYMLLQIWDDQDFKNLGVIRYLLLVLSALNMYWFAKIVNMAKKQLS
jgi:hypothetical protein